MTDDTRDRDSKDAPANGPANGNGADKPASGPAAGPATREAVRAAENEGMGEAIGAAHPHENPLTDQLTAQVEALSKQRDDLKDSMLRALAETENVRKRANREIADARAYAVEKFARDLLNVADSLGRAMDSLRPGERALLPEQARTLLDGVDITQKEMMAVLARNGVTAIDAQPGASFDPALHQAVTQIPSSQPAGTVAELFQSGWKIGDRTLRAAMVAVSAGGG